MYKIAIITDNKIKLQLCRPNNENSLIHIRPASKPYALKEHAKFRKPNPSLAQLPQYNCTTTASGSFTSAAPRKWKNLPTDIRNSTSLTVAYTEGGAEGAA